jgi:hypothetical protein
MSGSLTAAETLLLLAEDFAAAEPLQAVKCLEALLQAESPALPLVEVRARLRLASLLLEYTDNVAHAKSHLEHAVRRAHTKSACGKGSTCACIFAHTRVWAWRR